MVVTLFHLNAFFLFLLVAWLPVLFGFDKNFWFQFWIGNSLYLMEHGTLGMNYKNTFFKFMKTPILSFSLKKLKLSLVWNKSGFHIHYTSHGKRLCNRFCTTI
jgi:hypothetical protein